MFPSCNHPNFKNPSREIISSADTTASKTKHNFNLVSNTDLVCGISIKEYCSDTSVYQKKTYGFCCSGCKYEFDHHPKKYVKQ